MAWKGACIAMVCVKSQFCGISSLFPSLHEFQRPNLGHQAYMARTFSQSLLTSLLLGLSTGGTSTPEQCRAFFVGNPGVALLSDYNVLLKVHLDSYSHEIN